MKTHIATKCFTAGLMFVVCASACASDDSPSDSEGSDGVGAGGGTSSATGADDAAGGAGTGDSTGGATSGDDGAGGSSTGASPTTDRTSDSPGMPADTTSGSGAGGNSGQTGDGAGGAGGSGDPTTDPTNDGAGGGAGNDPTDDAAADDGMTGDGAGGADAADDSTDTGAGGMMGADDDAETGAGGMMGSGADDDATPDTAEPRCPAAMTEASKTVVRDGITAVFINGNGAVIDDYWADPYIQHNPGATSGVDTFKGFFANVSPGFYSLTRLIGECDLVLIHGSYGSGGTFDMLRVDQDKMRMVEHWDAGMSGNDLLGGPTEVTDLELTEANRAVVDGFTDEVMIGGNADATSTYLAASVTEHGADQFAQRLSGGDSYSTVHHQIAEGNFVFTLSEGVSGGNATGFWDLYRVDGGLIVEHWGAKLGVQAGASGEGIF